MVNNSKYLTPVVITVSLIIMIFINLRLIRTPMLLTYLIFSVVMSIKAHHSKSKKQLLNLEKVKRFSILNQILEVLILILYITLIVIQTENKVKALDIVMGIILYLFIVKNSFAYFDRTEE